MTNVSSRPVTLRPRRRLGRAQAQIWTSRRLQPGAPVANMATFTRIDARLDAERFVRAFDEVVRCSDSLRTVFEDIDGVPHSRVRDEPPSVTELVDLPAAELDSWCAARIAVPLDESSCCYDSVLLRHDADHWTWWLDLSHLVTDATSSALVFEATSDAYRGIEPDLASFQDHMARLASEEENPDWRAARERWLGLTPQPPLALYGPAGPPTSAVDQLTLELDPVERQSLRQALEDPYGSISPELSLLGLLATTVAVLVHRIDGRTETTVGVPVHHRTGQQSARVVGPVLELFPLTMEIAPDDTYREVHRRVLRAIFDLLRWARPGTSPDQRIDVVVNVLSARYGHFAGLPSRTEWVRPGHVDPGHLLRLHTYDHTGSDLRLELDVNRAVGTEVSRELLPGHLRAVLLDAVGDPDRVIGDTDLLGTEERALVKSLSPDPLPYQVGETVDATIRDRLRARPDLVVLEQDGVEMTAGELDARADAVAAWLRDRGVAVGSRVGLAVGRTFEAVILVHGVLRAGAAFVMLDRDDPPHRRQSIVDDADLAFVLDGVPDGAALDASLDAGSEARPGLDDTAYILYTSGSTGPPKGVPIPHRGLADYMAFAIERYVDPARPPVVALHSSLVFDLTITSLFLPLLVGGRLVILRQGGLEAMQSVAADDRIDFLKATPSQLELYVRLVRSRRPLRSLVVGGEAFRRPLAMRLLECCEPGVRIYNEYGPTEAVVGCMIHEFDPARDLGADVPIGHATPGAQVAILDGYQKPVPVGSWGELYVRRPGMASEYLNRPDLSRERFAAVAAVRGGPLYRTGDRARMERPGVATYGGRLDDQLKVGGVRVEPGEIESALVTHPRISSAIVRLWEPGRAGAVQQRCTRCGLGSDVPGTSFDERGVCSTCLAFDQVRPQAAAWFRDLEDLELRRREARRRRRGRYDCLHLLSGGKDSTYALYQLVQQGWEVHALTLDNGYLSDGARQNIERTVADLGISHEFVTTPTMNEIFRDSLERFSNVCNGCYKTIYTLAVNRAHELGIPAIVTGLSRGQFFETRLVPHQFEADHFDSDAIDEAVLEARKVYHRTDDAVARLLDTSLFETDEIFEEIEFIDFYRYVDVDLAELYRFLENRAPWVRPSDTGRSTNCLVNVAGIHVHRLERGFHNYALPYSWDVKLGHKTRDEALEELDDEIDEREVERMLAEIGYQPDPPKVLTAWYCAPEAVEPEELRAHLRELLPDHAIPTAFVRIDHIPTAASAKIDIEALPPPTRFNRPSEGYQPPTNPTEERLCEIWGEVLHLEQVGIDDDFFDLGGTSLGALEMVALVSASFRADLPDAAAFRRSTVRSLARLLDGAGEPVTPAERVHEIPVTTGPPKLTPGQEALLFEVRADPTSPRYGVTRRYTIEGAFDVEAFHDALTEVVTIHEPLRWTFGTPRRELRIDEALEWRVEPDGGDIGALARREAARVFDLDDGPLVRAVVVPGSPTELILSLHHLWCDAGSFDVLWSHLERVYSGRTAPELPVRYSDHGCWLSGQVTESDRQFWRDLLPDAATAPSLELVRPVAPEANGYLRREVAIDGRNPSIFPAFLAAVATTLDAYSDDPVVVGVPVSTRDRDSSELVGYFLNTVAVPLPDPEGKTFAQLVRETQEMLAGVLRHRLVPFAEVVADRRRAGLPSDLVRVMVVHAPPPANSLPDARMASETVANGAAVTELSLFVTETDDGAHLAAEWSGERFRRADVSGLLAHLADVLGAGLGQPDAPAVEPLQAARPPDLHGPDLDADPAPVTSSIWSRSADSAIAVSQGERRLSYAELIGAADRIAGHLLERGITSGDRVAVMLPRRVELPMVLLGIQRVGAAYVPVDPSYPPPRVAAILGSSQPGLMITDRDGVLDTTELPTADVDVLLSTSPSPRDLGPLPDLDDPAYVIHTSGSTGGPRGVEVRHRQLAASNHARRQHYGRDPGRFLWVSSYGFDSSIVGLFWTLTTGGELVLPDEGPVDVDRVVDDIERHDITHLLTVPSLWSAILTRGQARLSPLECVIVAGEPCRPDLVTRHHATLPGTELWNEYGPTEATVWATVHRCHSGEDPVPIGTVIPGAVARVADADLRTRPIGAAGELLLGGAGLTDGYLDPRATAERFVTDPCGERFYRTGDRVLRRADGTLDFLGRIDEQLSVGGIRVEPDEIERAICSDAGVRAAVVRSEPRQVVDVAEALGALDPDQARAALRRAAESERPVDALVAEVAEATGARSTLVAHVEADLLDERALRDRLGSELPSELVPVRYVRHDLLPRSIHGKIDRRAIALATSRVPAPAPADPLDPAVARIVGIWRRLLADPSIGPDTDFFDAGGDSLTAVEVVEAVRRELGFDAPVSALLAEPTPRDMARLASPEVVEARSLRVELNEGDRLDPPVVLVGTGGGGLFAYRSLISELDDRLTLTGLQHPGVDQGSEPIATVRGLAERLALELTGEPADAPLRLVGASTGGLVAYELAHCLRESGRAVETVLLIDTHFPGQVTEDRPTRRDRYGTLLRSRQYEAMFRAVTASLLKRQQRLRTRITRAVRARRGLPIEIPVNERMLAIANEAQLHYRPEPIDVPVVLYAASGTSPERTIHQWRTIVDDLAVVPVEGRHHGPDGVMSPSRVGAIAADMNARLRRNGA